MNVPQNSAIYFKSQNINRGEHKFFFNIIISDGADGGPHSLVSFFDLNQFCSCHMNVLTVVGIYPPVNGILFMMCHALCIKTRTIRISVGLQLVEYLYLNSFLKIIFSNSISLPAMCLKIKC